MTEPGLRGQRLAASSISMTLFMRDMSITVPSVCDAGSEGVVAAHGADGAWETRRVPQDRLDFGDGLSGVRAAAASSLMLPS